MPVTLPLAYRAAALLLLAVSCAGRVGAQAPVVITGDELDADRYADHKGSPYRFGDDLPGFATLVGGERVGIASLNYNGFTEEFEAVRDDGARIALDPTDYPSVHVIDGGDTLAFVRGVRPRHPGKYALALYRGPEAALFEAFTASEGETTVQNVGKTETFLRFAPKPLYFLSLGGEEPRLVSLRRKPFLKALAGAANAGELEKVWKRAGGSDEERAAAVLAAYRPA